MCISVLIWTFYSDNQSLIERNKKKKEKKKQLTPLEGKSSMGSVKIPLVYYSKS